MTPHVPTWLELRLVLPEVWLSIGMCAVILVPFIKRNVALPTAAALVSLFAALVATVMSMSHANELVFERMLAIDLFSQFFKVLLIVFTILVIVQWLIATRRQTDLGDVPDFLCLLLGAALGMSLMASATNLLMIFIATEAASFPSYALAGFRKRHRVGSEGSLKYVVFGAAASAIMVYGMSLIYGVSGTLRLSEVASHAAAHGISPIMAAGLLAMFAGFAFKLSAVPLHFWCPDVFQGAPMEVTTFLSVASKGAAVCLLLRVLMVFGVAGEAVGGGGVTFTGLGVGVAILGGVTATWGNLVALHQTNIKRLLAYSSIAHAGYMIMASSLIVWNPAGSPNPIAGSILFYLLIYLFMNLGAFTVAAIIAGPTGGGSEDIRDYAGLSRRAPVLALLLSVFVLSLFGMPGLGGFWGKIYLMKGMADLGSGGFALIAVLLINTLLSFAYYARPIYYMYFLPDPEARPAFFPQVAGVALLVVCALALLWTGILPGSAGDLANDYATIKPSDAVIVPAAPALPERAANPSDAVAPLSLLESAR
jgi:NADH-quinone oxidoreductase subunit N